MKKLILLFATFFFLTMTACASENAPKGDTMNITITITNDDGRTHTLTAALAENKSALAFAELLQKGAVTVFMHDYGDFEKVGLLGASLVRSDTQITTEAGDIILYQGNQITIYYDTNRWNFTRLGKINGVTQAELKAILGQGSVTAVFAVKP